MTETYGRRRGRLAAAKTEPKPEPKPIVHVPVKKKRGPRRKKDVT